MAPRSDESVAATKCINFSPSLRSIYFLLSPRSIFFLRYPSFALVLGPKSLNCIHRLLDAQRTRIIRGYVRGARVYTHPAGNNWWYAFGRRVLHRATRRGTEKHRAAIYYRRLSIIDAGCIAVKRDSPLPYNSVLEYRFFFTAYWFVERFISRYSLRY